MMFKALATTALLFTSIAGAPSVEARTQSHPALCQVDYLNQYGRSETATGIGSLVFKYSNSTTLTVTAPR
jgi:hypothetical protein